MFSLTLLTEKGLNATHVIRLRGRLCEKKLEDVG